MNQIHPFYQQEWGCLDSAEKKRLFLNWDTQNGEGFPIAITALARLVVDYCSQFLIATANVGIYHGGTFILHVSFSKDCILSDANELPSEFEGFPVIWKSHRNEWVGGFRMGG